MTATPASADLKALYETRLRPRLAELEGERAKLKFAIFASVLLVGLPVLAFFISADIIGSDWLPAVAIVFVFIGAGVAFWKFAVPGMTAYVNYHARFKRDIVAEIFAAVCPGSRYEPDRYITKELFNAAGVFADRGTFGGDDLVRGRLGQTPFEASELQREYTEGSGNDQKTKVIFHGLFYHLDFNKTIHGRTVIQPEGVEHWRLGDRSGLSLVKLEDPEFEKLFAVYSTNPVEARYILTPAFMERLVEIRRKAARPVFVGFAGNSVFVAVHYGSSLFEPSIAETTSFEALEAMADHFRQAEKLVQELDLNTRIWTKEVDASLLEQAPEVSPLEEMGAGNLDETSFIARASQMAGKAYEDANVGAAPEAPDRTRVGFDNSVDGFVVRYGLKWWFVPCLLIALATVVIAPLALAGIVSLPFRAALARFLTPNPTGDFISSLRTWCIVAAIGVPIVGLLPTLMVLGYVRRVRIGRDAIEVTRGLRLTPRRYPRTDQSRILQMDTCVFLGRAGQFKIVGNVTLSPALDSAQEARWISWKMREAMENH